MKRITEKMLQGIDTSTFPGGVLLIAYQDKIVLHKAFGSAMTSPSRIQMTCDTYFDLASLTKPLVTATAVAVLLQKELLALADPLSRYLPSFSGKGKAQVTLFHLLTHSAGLPAWRPYYENILERKKANEDIDSNEAKKLVYEMAHREALISPPGQISRYSDIGFILLGEVIEKLSNMPLDLFFNHHIRSAAKSSESFFIAKAQGKPPSDQGSFAATEHSSWREEMILGSVHDDNAYVMGGVAGHAGLFSTSLGLYALVRTWIASIKGSGFLDSKIATDFVSRQEGASAPSGSSWGLGWDTPSHPVNGSQPGISSSGHYFSPSSFGHLGFTGSSLWVDRTTQLLVIFLTNRVHPSSKNEGIRTFRPELHDIIFEEIVDAKVRKPTH